MDNNAEGDNLNLSSGENDIGDELKIGADETYDTRSEVSSSSSDSDDDDEDDDDDSSQHSAASASSKSSKEEKEEKQEKEETKSNQKSRRKRKPSRDSSSASPVDKKRARSKESAKQKIKTLSSAKTYDYATKLNYLFRDARYYELFILLISLEYAYCKFFQATDEQNFYAK